MLQDNILHMAGVFRFSNAVSDITKFIQTYRSIYEHFYPTTSRGEYFGHKEAYQFLANSGLASSLGAIGAEAIRRSERKDTSRDPLYNQHKMYSEIYRMLGWYEPGSMKTNFNLPEYGYYIAHSDPATVAKLFALNVLHIVSPNPLTSVKGGNILRPFPLILKMMGSLNGYLTRDEMILTVLACPDDRERDYVPKASERIQRIRKAGLEALQSEIKALKDRVGINSKDALPNYTRFPIAAMKWTGWAEGIHTKDLYQGASVATLKMTESGRSELQRISDAIDIRFEDIMEHSRDAQAAFSVWSNLKQLQHIGFDISGYSDIIPLLKSTAAPIFVKYGIDDKHDLLFFGYQEAPREILKRGNQLIGE